MNKEAMHTSAFHTGLSITLMSLSLSLSLAASLRAELNHLHATSIEHLKQIHLKENTAAKRELENAMEHSHKQVTVAKEVSLFIVIVFVCDLVNILQLTS